MEMENKIKYSSNKEYGNKDRQKQEEEIRTSESRQH